MLRKNAPVRQKAAFGVLGAACIIVAGLLWYQFFGPPSPEKIRDQALRAFHDKDAETLCKLADPDELKQLHLTPQNVRALLNETLWKKNVAPIKRVMLFSDKPSDRRTWIVEWADDQAIRSRFAVSAVDNPHVGWHLVLSESLLHTYKREYGWDGGTFNQRCRTLGITGIRTQDGAYMFFKPRPSGS